MGRRQAEIWQCGTCHRKYPSPGPILQVGHSCPKKNGGIGPKSWSSFKKVK